MYIYLHVFYTTYILHVYICYIHIYMYIYVYIYIYMYIYVYIYFTYILHLWLPLCNGLGPVLSCYVVSDSLQPRGL